MRTENLLYGFNDLTEIGGSIKGVFLLICGPKPLFKKKNTKLDL